MNKSAVKVCFAAAVCVLCFSGCQQSSGSGLENAGKTGVYKVEQTQTSLTVDGLKAGQSVYFADINNSDTVISAETCRRLTGASGGTVAKSAYGMMAGEADVAEDAVSASGLPDMPLRDDFSHQNIPVSFMKRNSASRSLSAVRTFPGGASKSVVQLDRTVGTAQKKIWVNDAYGGSGWEQKSATLQAKGDHCNVWVMDDALGSDGSDMTKVTQTQAQTMAEKFESMYGAERNVFGTESDMIYGKFTGTETDPSFDLADMDTLSDTGTYINIVLYHMSTNTLCGYFWDKDFYPDGTDYKKLSTFDYPENYVSTKYSNEGKYFYMSIYRINDNQEDSYLTLCHEYQHMIQVNMKEITQGLSIPAWYTEMCSMLCEDMFQAYLGFPDSLSPKNRLPYFNSGYRKVGLESGYSGTEYYIFYGVSYAFGAWCARQFGGAGFVKELCANNAVGLSSVTAAANKINGTSYTDSDILKMYAEACIFSDTSLGMPTFNKNAAQTLTDVSGYTYPMTAINLRDAAYGWKPDYIVNPTSSGIKDDLFLGPALYSVAGYYDIRPHGFILHKVGTVTADSVTLNFSAGTAAGEELYVMIQ